MLERMSVCGVLLGLSTAVFGQVPDGSMPSGRCALLEDLALPGIALEVTGTEWHPAGSTPPPTPPWPAPGWKLPAYCRVDGMIDRRAGAGGKPYGIGFARA